MCRPTDGRGSLRGGPDVTDPRSRQLRPAGTRVPGSPRAVARPSRPPACAKSRWPCGPAAEIRPKSSGAGRRIRTSAGARFKSHSKSRLLRPECRPAVADTMTLSKRSCSRSLRSASPYVRPVAVRGSTGMPCAAARCSIASINGIPVAGLSQQRGVERQVSRDPRKKRRNDRRALRLGQPYRRLERAARDLRTRERQQDASRGERPFPLTVPSTRRQPISGENSTRHRHYHNNDDHGDAHGRPSVWPRSAAKSSRGHPPAARR